MSNANTRSQSSSRSRSQTNSRHESSELIKNIERVFNSAESELTTHLDSYFSRSKLNAPDTMKFMVRFLQVRDYWATSPTRLYDILKTKVATISRVKFDIEQYSDKEAVRRIQWIHETCYYDTLNALREYAREAKDRADEAAYESACRYITNYTYEQSEATYLIAHTSGKIVSSENIRDGCDFSHIPMAYVPTTSEFVQIEQFMLTLSEQKKVQFITEVANIYKEADGTDVCINWEAITRPYRQPATSNHVAGGWLKNFKELTLGKQVELVVNVCILGGPLLVGLGLAAGLFLAVSPVVIPLYFIDKHVENKELKAKQPGGGGRPSRVQKGSTKKKTPTKQPTKWQLTERTVVLKDGRTKRSVFRNAATGELRIRKRVISNTAFLPPKYVFRYVKF